MVRVRRFADIVAALAAGAATATGAALAALPDTPQAWALLLAHLGWGALAALALLLHPTHRRGIWRVLCGLVVLTGLRALVPGTVGIVAHLVALVLLLVVVALEWRPWLKLLPAGIAGALLAAAALWVSPGETVALPEGWHALYEGGAFAPSELTLVDGRVLGGSEIAGRALAQPGLAGSAGCGVAGCHETIARQWAASAHRAAGTDVFYRFAVDRMGEDYGWAATRLCAGCHEPGGTLAAGIGEGAVRDAQAREEGVSCLSCHLARCVRDVPPHGVPANGSLIIEPAPPALTHPVGVGRLALAPHKRFMRRPLLSTNRFCAACHQFFVPPALGGQPPGRLRLQVAEAAGTRFGDPSHPEYQSCVDCHMPRIPGEDPAAKGGMITDHRALGANVLLPALSGDTAQADATRAFRTAAKGLRLRLEPAVRDPGDGRVRLPVVVTNVGIGHDFPTGATDVSEVWAEVQVHDAAGAVVGRSPSVDDAGILHPDVPNLSTIVALPGGEPDFLHDLFGQVALLQHPRVKIGKSQRLEVPVAVPDGVAGPLTARAVLRYRRGNGLWNNWTFEWQQIPLPITDLAEAKAVFVMPPAAPAGEAPAAVAPAPAQIPGMVWVPAGSYRVGASAADPDADPEELPAHTVQVRGFYLDRVPVTNDRWQRRMKAAGLNAPPRMVEPGLAEASWQDGAPRPGTEDWPVVFVTALEAEAWCASLGKRLPTEVEWEVAARGPTDRRWPWGDAFDPGLCNTSEAGHDQPVRVGAFPDNAGVVGALDMGCNVSEWVQSDYAAWPRHGASPDNRDDWFTHFRTGLRSIRGSSYLLSAHRARTTARSFEHEMERKVIGFRCARDVEGSP